MKTNDLPKKNQLLGAGLFILLIAVFIVLRFATAFQSLDTFARSFFDILVYKRNYSYDQKMQDIFGAQYKYYWQVVRATPENSVIYLPQLPYRGIEKNTARYFLYPRQVVIGRPDPELAIPENAEEFIGLIDDSPDFSVNAKEIIIFADGFEVNHSRFGAGIYKPSSFKGRNGLIRIK